MSKVMKADASAGNAYVLFDFPLGESAVWYSFGLAVPTAAWLAWTTGGGAAMLFGKSASSSQNLRLNAGQWETEFGGFGASVDPGQENVYLDCEMHLTASLTEFFIGGASVFSGADVGGTLSHFLLGLRNAPADPSSVVYFSYAKAGTTRGGDDIFPLDDFSSGDLSAWTDVNGDVSVVDDPLTPLLIQVFVAAGLDPQDGDFTLGNRSGGGPSEWPVGLRRGTFDVLTIDEAQQTQLLSARITQTGPSARTEIYSLDIAMRPMPSALEGDNQ